MTLHQLRILRTVIEKRSFARAAEALRISQPAISLQISRLEKELECALIRRSSARKYVEPTEAGHLVYRTAVKVFEAIDQLRSDLEIARGQQRPVYRTIHVVCDVPVGIYIAPALVTEFSANRRDVKVAISIQSRNALVRGLAREAYDLAIVPQEIDSPGAVTEFGFSLELAVVANPLLPLPSERSQWASLPMVLPPPGSIMRLTVESYLSRLGIVPNTVLELNHPEAIKIAVRTAPLVTITHRVSVEDDVQAGVLMRLDPPEPLPQLLYKLVRTRSRLDGDIRSFVTFLKERLAIGCQ